MCCLRMFRQASAHINTIRSCPTMWPLWYNKLDYPKVFSLIIASSYIQRSLCLIKQSFQQKLNRLFPRLKHQPKGCQEPFKENTLPMMTMICLSKYQVRTISTTLVFWKICSRLKVSKRKTAPLEHLVGIRNLQKRLSLTHIHGWGWGSFEFETCINKWRST